MAKVSILAEDVLAVGSVVLVVSVLAQLLPEAVDLMVEVEGRVVAIREDGLGVLHCHSVVD